MDPRRRAQPTTATVPLGRLGGPHRPGRLRAPGGLGAAAIFAALSVLAGCGAGTPGPRDPDRPLPPYAGHAVDLFDDAIEPLAVGYPMDNSASPQGDTRLRERTQTGDAVVRARVLTVTSKVEDSGRSWQIGLHTLERLGGSGPLEKDFALSVGPHDPGAGIVQAFESRLIGKSLVVFVREFAHEGAPAAKAGEARDPGDLRFHIAADSPDVLKAVNAAVLAQQVR
ncbi:MAG: hypothetical protein ACRELB_01510 [Polyangiaceae bacterium]